MIIFFDPRQRLHAPLRELHNGEWIAYNEVPARATFIAQHFSSIAEPEDHGMSPLLRVHDRDYLEFLRTAHEDWVAAGRAGDVIGYSFPVVQRRPLSLTRIDAKAGQYAFDAATPVTAHTWTSAYWSAQTALSATTFAARSGKGAAFGLCRPPGHHAGRNYMGGYCYLNNAAIAARHAQDLGFRRVAVLDIDYHHGNGTQDIFYGDQNVLFVSVHGDPQRDYPFFWGHADERGEGSASGSTLNFPLPHGTKIDKYRETLALALRSIETWKADFLVLSFGADTFEDDPISNFSIRREDFPVLSRDIAGVGLPTVILMEGGYNVAALGENVAAFIRGFGQGRREGSHEADCSF